MLKILLLNLALFIGMKCFHRSQSFHKRRLWSRATVSLDVLNRSNSWSIDGCIFKSLSAGRFLQFQPMHNIPSVYTGLIRHNVSLWVSQWVSPSASCDETTAAGISFCCKSPFFNMYFCWGILKWLKFGSFAYSIWPLKLHVFLTTYLNQLHILFGHIFLSTFHIFIESECLCMYF